MKFTNQSWAAYRMLFPVADTDRARIEQERTIQQEHLRAEAGGDEMLMFGFFDLDTAKEIAEVRGCSQDEVLESFIRMTPQEFRATASRYSPCAECQRWALSKI